MLIFIHDMIFVFQRDGYENTGCYNLNCPGFVITNRAHSPGFRITPLSTFNGEQRGIALTIHKVIGNAVQC